MPVPADAPPPTDATAVVLGLFRQVHDQVRGELGGLDDEGLAWVPAEGSNCIAVIVGHLIGSEGETLRCVAGLPCPRDRDAEFSGSATDANALQALLDEADMLVAGVEPLIDHGRLETMLSLPTLPSDDRRSGLSWLIRNYGHACEHVGQIQMTAQMYRAET
jgi:Protein of unknown function (DUF1572)